MKNSSRVKNLIVCAFISLSIILTYWHVQDFEFISFDDGTYVYQKDYVKNGFTKDGLIWAFSFEKRGTYWHPFTWISHMLDCHLWGLNAGMHHITSVFIHIINSILLFIIFRSATGIFWSSAGVALLFAIHPINVESVSWIAERKNLLSTFFCFLTIFSYIYYTRFPSARRYFLVLLVFIMGLMSKPMLVSLPFILLLMDYWPLERFDVASIINNRSRQTEKQRFFKLFIEKLPFIFLALLSIFISIFSLQKGEMVVSTAMVPWDLRIANAIVSYVTYIIKFLLPINLTFFYPFPTEMLPISEIVLSLIALILISILILKQYKKRPYLSIGWLWYLIALAPVSGIIQGGLWPSIAERWAYFPFIGLYIIILSSLMDISNRIPFVKVGLIIIGPFIYATLIFLTFNQVNVWADSSTLYQHAIAVSDNNHIAHTNLGLEYDNQENDEKALYHLKKAVTVQPLFAHGHYNLATFLFKHEKYELAEKELQTAIRLNPYYDEAYNNLGNVYYKEGMMDEAAENFLKAIKLSPNNVEYQKNLLFVPINEKYQLSATRILQESLEKDPNSAATHYVLGYLLIESNDFDKAIYHLKKTISIDPDYYQAYNGLAIAYSQTGKIDYAIKNYRKTISIKPDFAEAHNNLGNLLLQQGNTNDAISHFLDALVSNPGTPDTYNNLGGAYLMQKEVFRAIENFRKALELDPTNKEAYGNLRNAESIQQLRYEEIAAAEKAKLEETHDTSSITAVHLKLAQLYFQNENFEKAVGHYSRVLSEFPTMISVLNNLGASCMYMDNYEEAKTYFMKAIEIKPDDVTAYYNLSCLYARQEKNDEALKSLEMAVNKGFDNLELLRTDVDLLNIRKSPYYQKLLERGTPEIEISS